MPIDDSYDLINSLVEQVREQTPWSIGYVRNRDTVTFSGAFESESAVSLDEFIGFLKGLLAPVSYFQDKRELCLEPHELLSAICTACNVCGLDASFDGTEAECETIVSAGGLMVSIKSRNVEPDDVEPMESEPVWNSGSEDQREGRSNRGWKAEEDA